jgi:hypothetical protein
MQDFGGFFLNRKSLESTGPEEEEGEVSETEPDDSDLLTDPEDEYIEVSNLILV